MASVNCQYDRIQTHMGDVPHNMPVRYYLDYINGCGKTHPCCRQVHSLGQMIPEGIKWRRETEHVCAHHSLLLSVDIK